MSCGTLTQSFLNPGDCTVNNVGGIYAVYFLDWVDDAETTYGITISSGEVTGISSLPTGASALRKYVTKHETSGYNSAGVKAGKTQGAGVTATDEITLAFDVISVERLNELKLLTKGLYIVFSEFNNGRIVVSGIRTGCSYVDDTITVSGEMTQRTVFQFKLSCMERIEDSRLVLDSTAVAELKAGVDLPTV